jgi:succinate dehydrogenase / fumarate reductase, cytochrome b subunit
MSHGAFYLKRLHSLSGIFLLAFLCVHFFLNSYATVGSGAFNTAASFMHTLPHLTIVEVLLLGIPIAFHGIYGLLLWYRGRGNLGRYRYFRNWMYFLQEISGAVLLVFLVMHIWGTRIAGAMAGAGVDFQWMTRHFADPLYLAVTCLGILAASFHGANGMWGFLINAGFMTGKRAQRAIGWFCGLIFGIGFLGFTRTLVSFIQ